MRIRSRGLPAAVAVFVLGPGGAARAQQDDNHRGRAPASSQGEGSAGPHAERNGSSQAEAQSPQEIAKAKTSARNRLRVGDVKFRAAERALQARRDDRAAALFQEAIAEYQEAYRLYPSAKIYFPIASAQERLGRIADAYQSYARVIGSGEDVGDKLRRRVQARQAELRGGLAIVAIAVSPDGASVAVDGRVLGVAPLAEPVPFAPGDHELRVSLEGHRDHVEIVTTEAGTEASREIVLQPIPTVVAKNPGPTEQPLGPRAAVKPQPSRLGLWIAGTTTLALAVGATTTGVLAISKHSDFKDDALAAEARESARDAGRRLALTTDVLWTAALIGAGTTAYLWLRPSSRAAERAPARTARSARVWLAPLLAKDHAGLALGSWF
jgi:hypothetical protein